MPSYVDIETPSEIVPQILDMLSVAKDSGKVKKGVNETTKSIERKTAKFVVVAGDVSPEEIVVHIPMLCKEKGVPYAFVPGMKDLGISIGITKGTSSVAVENPGAAAEKLQDIIKRMPRHGAAKEEVKEAPKKEVKKEAPKKEEKPAEKKEPAKEEKPAEKKEPKKEEPPRKEEKPPEKKEPKKEEAPKKEEKPKEEPKKPEPKPKEEPKEQKPEAKKE